MAALDMSFSLPTLIVAGAAVLLLLAGCTPASPKAADHTRGAASATAVAFTTPAPSVGTAATAVGPRIDVRATPTGAVVLTFDNPQPSGAPLTFLVVSAQKDSLRVRLLQRPNGSTGWISGAAVSQHRLEYSLAVSTEKNTASLHHGTTLVTTYTAAPRS